MRAKKYLIAANEIKLLLTDWDGADGCIATDRITVDGLPVGYMYREKPAEGTEFEGYDSGGASFTTKTTNTLTMRTTAASTS